MEEGQNIDTVYLDYAKAFDKVDHGLLGIKLRKLDIRGNLCKWLESFLADRVQTVKVGNHSSDPEPVVSGVPQGSVLGPSYSLYS